MKFKKVITENNEYILQKVIGEGGESQVFYAINRNGREVAVKMFKNLSKEQIARVKEEIAFLQKGHNSKYIVSVIDYGEFVKGKNEYYFYVMPLMKYSFRAVINDTTKSQFDRLKYFLNLCIALKYIHRRGIIHRDIKPENLLYDEEMDSVKLSDFGIAHFCNSEITTKNKRLANFNYHAPEQRIKSVGKIGSHTDIFAAGLILNEIFTNQIPKGKNYLQIQDIYPMWFRLDNIVDEMIEFDPQKREKKINNVINKLKYIIENIDLDVKEVSITLQVNGDNSDRDKCDKLFERACFDIAFINRFVDENGQATPKGCCLDLMYKLSHAFADSLLLIEIYDILKRKVKYESNVVKLRSEYVGLNLDEEKVKSIYQEFCDILQELVLYQDVDYLLGRCVKMFLSLKYYHAKEVLNDLNKLIGDNYREKMYSIVDVANFTNIYLSHVSIDDNFNLAQYVILNLDVSTAPANICKGENLNEKEKLILDKLSEVFTETTIWKRKTNFLIIFGDKDEKKELLKYAKIVFEKSEGILKFDMQDLISKIGANDSSTLIDSYELENLICLIVKEKTKCP